MNRGFVLHTPTRQQWQSSQQVSPELMLTTSQDILTAIAHNEGPDDCLVALGYAGWGAGQLESELAENAWLTAPARQRHHFSHPAGATGGGGCRQTRRQPQPDFLPGRARLTLDAKKTGHTALL